MMAKAGAEPAATVRQRSSVLLQLSYTMTRHLASSILLSLRTHRGVRVVRTDGGRVPTVDHRENSLFFFLYSINHIRNLPNA
jgi:hypothetical protein